MMEHITRCEKHDTTFITEKGSMFDRCFVCVFEENADLWILVNVVKQNVHCNTGIQHSAKGFKQCPICDALATLEKEPCEKCNNLGSVHPMVKSPEGGFHLDIEQSVPCDCVTKDGGKNV